MEFISGNDLFSEELEEIDHIITENKENMYDIFDPLTCVCDQHAHVYLTTHEVKEEEVNGRCCFYCLYW